jgi:uncharacterized membrane protein YkvI
MADIQVHTIEKGRKNRETFATYAYQIVKHAIPGILLGFAIDIVIRKLQEKWKMSVLFWVVMQLVVSIVVLYLIDKYVSERYAMEWHTVAGGLFFVAFFFHTQFNLFRNLEVLSSSL